MTFGIPLLPRLFSHNWARVEHQINATVASIYNQSNPNFRILLAYTDAPRLRIQTDERLQPIHCDFWPVTPAYELGMMDKQRRVLMIADRHREHGAGYLMLADADDLISNRLVDYVLTDRHASGYLVQEGYVFRVDTGHIAKHPFVGWEEVSFDKTCGTCAIMNLSEEDCRTKELVIGGHIHWGEKYAEKGRPLKPVPFRSVVYVRQSGENISRLPHPDPRRVEKDAAFMAQVIKSAIPRTPELEEEFMLALAEYPRGWDRIRSRLSTRRPTPA